MTGNPLSKTVHWLNRECRRLLFTAVVSVKSTSFPELETKNHERSFISKSMLVSERPVSQIPNRSAPRVRGVYTRSPVSSTAVWIGLCIKISISLLTDVTSASDMMTSEWISQKMSLFITRARFAFLLFFVTEVTTLASLPPSPLRLPITFCTDSVMCLDTISSGLTSGDLFSAMSVNNLPPIRNVSGPTALDPSYSRGRTQRKILPKKLLMPCPRWG